MNMVTRFIELKAFVEFLKGLGFAFDVNSFDHRVMLQKYVFIARFLGWNHDYPYNIYIRGPYSPDLAKDYYKINISPASLEEDRNCLDGLDKKRFAQTIQEKNIEWLEVGTTMLSIYNNVKDKVEEDKIALLLLERTKNIKSEYDKDCFIENIFHDLKEYNLIRSS